MKKVLAAIVIITCFMVATPMSAHAARVKAPKYAVYYDYEKHKVLPFPRRGWTVRDGLVYGSAGFLRGQVTYYDYETYTDKILLKGWTVKADGQVYGSAGFLRGYISEPYIAPVPTPVPTTTTTAPVYEPWDLDKYMTDHGFVNCSYTLGNTVYLSGTLRESCASVYHGTVVGPYDTSKWGYYTTTTPTTTTPSYTTPTTTPTYTGGRCWVNGYTRSDGTRVSGYYRNC